jgi:hypothetical protein
MLRLGLVLDSYTSSAWVAKVIEDIQSSGFARLELVILNSRPEQGKSSLITKLRNRWRFTLFHLYERWDYKRKKADHDALAPANVSSLLNGVPSISVHSKGEDSAGSISEDQLTEICNHDLDVIFHFGFSVLRESIFSAARYGVWSFRHGGNSEDRDVAPLFGELAEWDPVSRSSLLTFTDSLDAGHVVYQSYASTDQVSLYGNRNPIYWKTAEFALRGLRDLHAGGIEYIQSLPAYREREGDTRRRNRKPNSLQMILFMRRYLSRWLQARRSPLRSGPRTKWYIAIRQRTTALRFDDSSNYQLMPCPKDRFYADPFLFEKDGKTYLFFEDFRYGEGRAVISYCELGVDGVPGSPVEVLRCPYHLSYPFVFEYEGEIYMIPETKESQMVELFRATNFPTTWTPEAVLLSNIYAVDATIQKVNGKFWMFAGISNGKYSNSDELSLFFADALTGPWTPHRNNPVLSNVQRSRPAGALFYDGGRLIRPSQGCGKAYGYALVFSEVVTLTETEYEEQPIIRIGSELIAGCAGTHTYNRTEQFEVVDRNLPVRIGNSEGAKVL